LRTHIISTKKVGVGALSAVTLSPELLTIDEER